MKKNNRFKGFSKVFSFTFRQHFKSKGYLASLIIVSLLCLLIPAGLMIGIELNSADNAGAPDDDFESGVVETESVADMKMLKNLYLVDLSDERVVRFDGLGEAIKESFGIDVNIEDFGTDFDKAAEKSKNSKDTLLVVTEQIGQEYTINIVAPEGSDSGELVTIIDAGMVLENLIMYYADINAIANGGEATYDTSLNVTDENVTDEEAQTLAEEEYKTETNHIVNMIVTYLNVMLLYFFVLIYGQGVANSIVMEKSSKLMESILVAVNPAAIIMGKLFAITLTGLLQLLSWVGSLIGGFAIGIAAVKAINPDTTMGIIQVLQIVRQISEGIFTPINIILAMIFIVVGMILYCSIAAIGGSMASKAEDLSSANVIFTLILLVSFFAAMFGGALEGESAPVLDWIPFVSVMVMPAKIMLGMSPLWKTLATTAIMLLLTVVAAAIGGKLYKSLVFYRGDVPGIKKIVNVLKG